MGSIVAQLIVFVINEFYPAVNKQGLAFIIFGFVMVAGAVFSWGYIPDVQRWMTDEDDARRKVLETKTLEDLGGGREKARLEGEVITVKEKWAALVARRRMRTDRLPSQ